MSTLRDVVEQAIADAFVSGAQWHAISRAGLDSAAVGRELRRWQDDRRFQQFVRFHQREAAEAVGRALLRLVLAPESEQMQLFGE